jgi:hypothetical protein
MGHPRPDAEKAYLDTKLGARWQRMLANGQIFNWFADYAVHESKIDREKIVKRLRVFSSRDESPTAFWVVLLTRFYEEGGHLGLRKYVEDSVTYHCPPQFFSDFKALCQSTPTYKCTVTWFFRPDYQTNGWIFADVFSPGKENWFKKSWPDALNLCGKRYLVSYYRAGSVNVLSDGDAEDDIEESTESYRNCHSLLCLILRTTSPAAYDRCLGDSAKERILEVLEDPYLAVSEPGFNEVALDIAAMCARFGESGKSTKVSPLQEKVANLFSSLATSYSYLMDSMIADADYMHMMTYPLMPLNKKGAYGALMADFESEMKSIVIEKADEILAAAKSLKDEDEDFALYMENDSGKVSGYNSLELIRRYLGDSMVRHYMPLEGFDALYQLSQTIEGKASKEIYVAPLKNIVEQRAGKLTESVECCGEFLITGPLMMALKQIGEVCIKGMTTDYGDLLFRRSSAHPWLRTNVKFSGEALRLNDTRDEFLAYCRILEG